MIRFFRQIRQELMNENKIRRYLLYATGEILLVVIGILIALGINKYNENLKEEAKEKQLIISLYNEFNENLTALETDIENLKTQLSRQYKRLDLIDGKSATTGSEINQLIGKSFVNLSSWNPSSYVLKDLSNSGQISNLSNHKLQNLLLDWERHIENLKEFKDDDKRSANEFVGYLKEKSSLRNIDFEEMIEVKEDFGRSKFMVDNKRLLKDIVFENMLDDKIITTWSLIEQYEVTLTKIQLILAETK